MVQKGGEEGIITIKIESIARCQGLLEWGRRGNYYYHDIIKN